MHDTTAAVAFGFTSTVSTRCIMWLKLQTEGVRAWPQSRSSFVTSDG